MSHGSPDELVPYEFMSPELVRIFAVMDRFYWDQQTRLDELKKRIHFLQVHLGDRGERDRVKRMAADLVFVVTPAKALPLRLFTAVLRAGRDSGYDRLALERAARPFEERVTALENETAEVIAKHDLRQAAAESYQH